MPLAVTTPASRANNGMREGRDMMLRTCSDDRIVLASSRRPPSSFGAAKTSHSVATPLAIPGAAMGFVPRPKPKRAMFYLHAETPDYLSRSEKAIKVALCGKTLTAEEWENARNAAGIVPEQLVASTAAARKKAHSVGSWVTLVEEPAAIAVDVVVSSPMKTSCSPQSSQHARAVTEVSHLSTCVLPPAILPLPAPVKTHKPSVRITHTTKRNFMKAPPMTRATTPIRIEGFDVPALENDYFAAASTVAPQKSDADAQGPIDTLVRLSPANPGLSSPPLVPVSRTSPSAGAGVSKSSSFTGYYRSLKEASSNSSSTASLLSPLVPVAVLSPDPMSPIAQLEDFAQLTSIRSKSQEMRRVVSQRGVQSSTSTLTTLDDGDANLSDESDTDDEGGEQFDMGPTIFASASTYERDCVSADKAARRAAASSSFHSSTGSAISASSSSWSSSDETNTVASSSIPSMGFGKSKSPPAIVTPMHVHANAMHDHSVIGGRCTLPMPISRNGTPTMSSAERKKKADFF